MKGNFFKFKRVEDIFKQKKIFLTFEFKINLPLVTRVNKLSNIHNYFEG